MSTPNRFDVTGKVAIVTGASSGIGRSFAETLAREGAVVVAAARREDRLEELANELDGVEGTVVPRTCDVTDAAQVDDLVSSAVEDHGRLDVLVNNAGVNIDGGPAPERLPREIFESVVQVNLMGVWYGCQAAARHMLASGEGGSIINVSSVLGLGGQQNYPPAYQATKAAVINLSRALAVSWGDRGVRVNVIAPGWFPSEMTEAYLGAPPFMDSIMLQQPMRRIGELDELSGALLFLASGASSYVTGHTLVVDGGLSASFGAPRHSPEVVEMLATVVPDGLGERIGEVV